MGGLSSFFGGDSGGLETTKVDKWNPQQKELFQQLYGMVSPELGKDLTKTAEEEDYGKFMGNYENWYKNQVNSSYDPSAVNKYYQDSVIPEFEATTLPQIQAQYAGAPGYWGSARTRAVSDAYAGLARQEASDVYDVEQKKQEAMFKLTETLPASKETLANWSRTFSAEQSPYVQLAMKMLGMEEFDTVSGMRESSAGFFDSLASSLGSEAGKGLANLWKK